MAKVLGILGTTASNVTTAQELPSLNGVSNAYVHSKVLANSNLIDAEGQIFSTAVCVPVRAGYGFWNYFESPDEEMHSVMFPSDKNLQRIEIRLRDLDGNILNVGQNNELVVVLRLYY
jgi:hypothetical protein